MIRQFSAGDLDSVMGIWLKANIKAHSFIPEKYWKDNFDKVKNDYIQVSETFVYEENDRILGFISVMEGGFIGAVFIEPERQFQGIGTKLVDFAREKYKKLSLAVYKNNSLAVSFYTKLGFVTEKEQLDEKTNEPELIMVL